MSMMSATILLDTDIIVAAFMSSRMNDLVSALRRHYRVGYPGVYFELDVMESQNIENHLKNRIISWARELFVDLGELDAKTERAALNRYTRWVKRIGKIDVLIAYTAIARGYIFATGDIEQARFYISLNASRNPNSYPRIMFIPVRILA